MKVRGIIWLDSVVEKIEHKHTVSRDEVRQVIQGHAMFRFVENGHRRGENVYAAIGEFWDEHDLSDFWDKTKPARADVDLESEESLYAIEKGLSETIRREARERGVSAHTMVDRWLQEKIQKLKPQARCG